MTNSPKKDPSAGRRFLNVVRDGWNNILSGIGSETYDKTKGASVEYTALDQQTAETLYAADDIAAKIVDELPYEAFREGFELTAKVEEEDEDDADEEFDPIVELKKKYGSEMERLAVMDRLAQAWTWARLYGGSAILLVDRDLLNLAEPLNEQKLSKIDAFQVLHRYELQVEEIEADILSTNFKRPKFYRVSPQGVATKDAMTKVHHTRVIRFDGVKLPDRQRQQNSNWDDSVLTRAQDAIKAYHQSNQAAAMCIQDLSVAVYKLKGLAELVSSGEDGDRAVIERMQIVNLTRSIARAVVIDAENEAFEYQTRNLTGLPDLLTKVSNRLVAAADRIPHTRLLGESPDGSNATGNSTTTQWYDFVASQQETYLKPRLMRVLSLIAMQSQGPFKGKVPEGLAVEFSPLWQMDEKEESEIRKNQADADAKYIEMGVLDADEIALSRFGSGKFSLATKIDVRSRRSLSKAPPEKPGMETGKPTGAPEGAAGAKPAAPSEGAQSIQKVALNGAQITALVDLVAQVASGALPRDAAIAMIEIGLQIEHAEAEKILGSVGKGFTPTVPAADPAPKPPAQKPTL